MDISVGQALLILIEKYKNTPQAKELTALYLVGAKDSQNSKKIHSYLKDPALAKYEISLDPHVTNDDPTRRYFETHLALSTLTNKITTIDSDEISSFYKALRNLTPSAYAEIYDDVLDGQFQPTDNTDKEYADYLTKIRNGEIFQSFEEKDKEKVKQIVSASYVAVIIASQAPHYVPLLDIYNTGIFLERGKKLKEDQKTTLNQALGLMKGHMPLSRDDDLMMEKAPSLLKPSDQADFDISKKWVKDNFEQLVHPFSNSISGTMLCQLRAILQIHANCKDNDPHKKNPLSLVHDSDKLSLYLTLFISAMLVNAGGHSLYEFTSLFSLPEVQTAFSDVEGFEKIDLEILFLNGNESAVSTSISKAIDYNNQLLMKNELQQALKSTAAPKYQSSQQASLIEQTKNSGLPKPIQNKFIEFIQSGPKDDIDFTIQQSCLKTAVGMKNILSLNENRISSEYFSWFREGASRNVILSSYLQKSINHLSKGEIEEGIQVISELRNQLEPYQSGNGRRLPELEQLDKLQQTPAFKELQYANRKEQESLLEPSSNTYNK